MYNAKLDIAVNTGPDEVWALMGPFASLAQWHPEVTSCEESQNDKGETLRTITYKNGQQVIERLLQHSDETRGYAYTIEKGKMPVRSFRGEVQVVGNAGQSRINWTATFDVVEGIPSERALAIVDGILQSAAPGLIAKFGAL